MRNLRSGMSVHRSNASARMTPVLTALDNAHENA
jgi:hypothetical protein